ncbi:MAG TPA: 2Fe-2S iron-sulfur cluster-binding protein [bacterium]|nr:2Fe-2S iron-sulfur cluster-binding protein [bacterium]
MPKLTIDGIEVEVEKGTTLLEAIRFLGINVPTLCYNDGLTPYGACRLCIVEIGKPPRSTIVSSCIYPAEDGLYVRANSEKVIKLRKLIIELMLATVSSSKTIQDLASKFGVTQCRFEPEHEECIHCGLCVRMCNEQMMSGAIAFAQRGKDMVITTPFDKTSEVCRQCGACMYICPCCELRCQGPDAETTVCNGCLNLEPPCLDTYEDKMCFLDPCAACELAGPFRSDMKKKDEA